MKRLPLLILAALFAVGVVAQDNKEENKDKDEDVGFIFDTLKINPITSVKDQNRAGTCWCYSGLAFVEAELLRMNKPEYDLSEMYIVYKTYQDRAAASVRLHGDISFVQGGSFGDVLYAIKHYGMMPDKEMPAGVMHGDSLSDFTEFSSAAEPFVKGIIGNKKLQVDADGIPLWKAAFNGILNAYLGTPPEKFNYNGTEYTPMSFAAATGFNTDDYVNLTSFSHHPFYEPFIIEVQDNWRWGTALNLPIDEFMEVMNNAVDNGYTVAWGSDVSEKGWLRGKMSGIAVLPDLKATTVDKAGSDMARWIGLNATDRAKEAQTKPTPQRIVNDNDRRIAYDNYETTDDHGMLIYGKAKDQLGNVYFIVKNSWGDYGQYKGSLFASEAFVRYKTLNIIVHKNAIPKDIRKKLHIK